LSSTPSDRLPALPRRFYSGDARVVAPALLNKVLVAGGRRGRIVEVEAYAGSEDPGSHAFRGLTKRNAVMFGPPGHLYVYFTYGMHWCANAVCSPPGEATAVLIRALEPLAGVAEMRVARSRGQRRPLSDRDLCRGPARLCQALGIGGEADGADLVSSDRGLRIGDDGFEPPASPVITTRVGLSAGADLPWRFAVPDSVYVSGRRAAGSGRDVEGDG
jgi:DNA-3-methyladenine glycosylase